MNEVAQVKQLKKGLLRRSIRRTAINTAEHGVGKGAAALTYYLVFAMFPLMIFVSNLLGLLDLNITYISETLRPIVPSEVVYLLEAYLSHVSNTSSTVLFWFSLGFCVWFPLRAVRSLMEDIRRAYNLDRPQKPIVYALRQLLLTVIFLVVIALTLILSVFGRKFILGAAQWLGIEQILQVSDAALNLWQYLRFALLSILMFSAIAMLYTFAQDKRCTVKSIMPGVVLSLVAWIIISIGFSLYVENFGKYSVIYGALGTVIVMLVWLYMTSFLLILGAEFNASLIAVRAEMTKVSEHKKMQPAEQR